MVNQESLMKKSVYDLMELLIELNRNTRHTVMFDYLGHTEDFSVRFYEGGWKEGMYPTENHSCYLDVEGWEDEVNEIYDHYFEILNKDHIAGYDEECGF